MITITGITSPSYALAGGEMIDVCLQTVEHGAIPCSLHPDDAAVYLMAGKQVTNGQLFGGAKRGVFGPVAPFRAPAAT
jgi:hypothetical protein